MSSRLNGLRYVNSGSPDSARRRQLRYHAAVTKARGIRLQEFAGDLVDPLRNCRGRLRPEQNQSGRIGATVGYPTTAKDAKMALVLESMIACPKCGFEKQEIMPTDACLFFYECTSCRALLSPEPGDCCVFCSYGTVLCPPKQQQQSCGPTSSCK